MKNKSKFYLSFLKKKFLEKEINQLAKKYIKERYIRLATISYDGIYNYTNMDLVSPQRNISSRFFATWARIIRKISGPMS